MQAEKSTKQFGAKRMPKTIPMTCVSCRQKVTPSSQGTCPWCGVRIRKPDKTVYTK